jgi:signal transduction histidine kinase
VTQNHSPNYNEVIFALLIGVLVLIILVCFIIAFIMFYQKKRSAHVTEINTVKLKFHQTLLQSQLEIQEQTLQHISHELHDNLGQVASLIKINLNTLQLNDTDKATEKIENTKELTRQLITDIKTLSVSLSSDRIAQTGLAKALEIEAERLNKTGQFEAGFVQEGNMPAIDNDKAVILYRMAQEALNNMVKHSGAKHIIVLLNATENLFTLALSDDGIGFNIDEQIKNGGAGLLNLQNRAKLINAQLSIQTAPGNGTRITIELPL